MALPSRQQGRSAPSRYHAPDSGSSEHRHVLSQGAVTSSAGLIPRPPWPLFPSLPTLKGGGPGAKCRRAVPAEPLSGRRSGPRARADSGPRGSELYIRLAGSPELGESRPSPGGGSDARRAPGREGRALGGGRGGPRAGEAPARLRRAPRLLAAAGPSPARPPPPPVTPGGRCSRDRSHPHPASPLPRLQPPPAELHYARQFRHFAKTKTRGRRKRRTKRKRRRRGERGDVNWEGGECSGHPLLILLRLPSSPEAQETFACLRPR